MNKIDTTEIMNEIKDNILQTKKIIIIGKGNTAKYIENRDEDTYYIAIKQSIIFIKIDVDLLIITDFGGLCGIKLHNVKYILCPYFLHDDTMKPNRKLDWNFTIKYLKEHNFTGKVCFIQLKQDLEKVDKYEIFHALNSGDLAFVFLNKINYKNPIITYGINIDTYYHKDILKLIENIKPKNRYHEKWLERYKNDIKEGKGQMNNKEYFLKNQELMKKRYNLNINFF